MNERVVEIIVYLVRQMQRNISIETIDVKRLSTDGYTDAEIGAACSWLLDRIAISNDYIRSTGLMRTFRVLHETERQLFRPEAYGYLLQLLEIGLLNSLELELLIERAYALGYYALTISDVQSLAGLLLSEANDGYHVSPPLPNSGSQGTIH